jgi:hypothetical protein
MSVGSPAYSLENLAVLSGYDMHIGDLSFVRSFTSPLARSERLHPRVHPEMGTRAFHNANRLENRPSGEGLGGVDRNLHP